MIFKELTIENFGIYLGKHIINLNIENNKPIILFGGLNGGGKTTFLDALQLVLYGKHAKCSNRGSEAYHSYLSNTKNIYSDKNSIIELSLTFSHTSETEIREYRIIRNWKTNIAEPVDKVIVYCDGERDIHISQFWDEFVNEFIPLSLSDLFFFDGEKIENLANPDKSGELIRTGIESLLGLDLLTQLHIDLSNVERKRKTGNLSNSIIQKVEIQEADIAEQTTIITKLKSDIAHLEKNISDNKLNINKARQKIRNAGAHLIDERDTIKFELGSIEEKLKHNQKERVKLDSGCGPLGLLSNLISETKNQISIEQKSTQAKNVKNEIKEYESAINQALTDSNASVKTISLVKKTMVSLATDHSKMSEVERYLNSDISIFNNLEDKIIDDKNERSILLNIRSELLEQQALFNKKLDSIPDFETVQHLLTSLATFEVEHNNNLVLLKDNNQLLTQGLLRNDVLNSRYTNLLTQQNKDTFEQKRAVQVAEHIKKLKLNMKLFSDKLIKENIILLENYITDKFFELSRKNDLLNKIQICPNSFEIILIDSSNKISSVNRLSAGERQLLAVATLWGLAEASGKEIPTVIDTPLGRLDGQHRSKLVNNYFPNASAQVILLSTDEEITNHYYQKLKPSICREFNIIYSENDKSSNITKGYF